MTIDEDGYEVFSESEEAAIEEWEVKMWRYEQDRNKREFDTVVSKCKEHGAPDHATAMRWARQAERA